MYVKYIILITLDLKNLLSCDKHDRCESVTPGFRLTKHILQDEHGFGDEVVRPSCTVSCYFDIILSYDQVVQSKL